MFERLACGLGRRGSATDVELGREIAASGDARAVATLVELLEDPAASSSAIKTLYECGYRAPDLLVPHAGSFFDLLGHRKNRLVWGAMIALMCVARSRPDLVWERRQEVMDAFAAGTVITQDAAVMAFSEVARPSPARQRELAPWFAHALGTCRPKDIAGWAAPILPALQGNAQKRVAEVVTARLEEIPSPSALKKVGCLLR